MTEFLKRLFGGFGRWFLHWVADSGVTPNQITCIGLLLVFINCGFYLLYRDAFWLGVGLSLSFAFDSLDGVIARLKGMQSKFGAYLDAVVDRCQEIAAFFAIAWVDNYWALVFLAATGSLLISYNKARAAMEIPIENKSWPDLLERPQRMWLLNGGLILDGAIRVPDFLGGRLLYLVLVILAALTYFTALQRFFRARGMLQSASTNGDGRPAGAQRRETIDANSWHGRLFTGLYSAFGKEAPRQFDLWFYGAAVFAAALLFVAGLIIFVVLNIGAIPLGVYFEPVWRANARFRRLRFPGGIPVIGIAVPIWALVGAWHNWIERGAALSVAPFAVMIVFGFGFLGLIVALNRLRTRLPMLGFGDSEAAPKPKDDIVREKFV
jgi:phosphatidylglycerophosphate synthase